VGVSGTVRAVAFANGEVGPETTADFVIRPLAPVISPDGGTFVGSTTVELSAEVGAQIYYTLDGSEPTPGSLLYAGPFAVGVSGTVRAVAFANGEVGPETTADFVIRPLAPVISPDGGTFVGSTTVELSAEVGAQIYYTLDGSEPTTGSSLYAGPFAVEVSGTVRAVAFANGEVGPETTADFVIRPLAPVISPDGGTFVGSITVALSAEVGAQIYYTLDGSEPTTGSNLYAEAFTIEVSAELRAVAVLNDLLSPIVSAAFSIVEESEELPYLSIQLLSDNSLRFTLSASKPLFEHQLQESSDLVSWVDLGASQAGDGNPLIWEFASEAGRGFYRVLITGAP
jgi:hypothetical protein